MKTNATSIKTPETAPIVTPATWLPLSAADDLLDSWEVDVGVGVPPGALVPVGGLDEVIIVVGVGELVGLAVVDVTKVATIVLRVGVTALGCSLHAL